MKPSQKTLSGPDAFKQCLHELFSSIDICVSERLTYPSLLLIFSGMDALAWIQFNKSGKEGFPQWFNKWILPNPEIDCTGIDLYAARCGWLHRMGPGAKLIKDGEAKFLNFCAGDADFSAFKQEDYDLKAKYGRSIGDITGIVKLESLAAAFKIGAEEFLKYSENNPTLTNRMKNYFNREAAYRIYI